MGGCGVSEMGVMDLGWVWRAWHGFKGLYEGVEGLRWVLKALVGMEGVR